MTEIIVFDDIEQIICDWLAPALAAHGFPVTVSTRVPNPRPASFARVMRTGGPIGSVMVLDNPTLTVEAWAARESTAANLIAIVRGLISATAGQVIAGVMFYKATEFSGPANLPDPDSAQVRYTYSASLLVRGHVLTP